MKERIVIFSDMEHLSNSLNLTFLPKVLEDKLHKRMTDQEIGQYRVQEREDKTYLIDQGKTPEKYEEKSQYNS